MKDMEQKTEEVLEERYCCWCGDLYEPPLADVRELYQNTYCSNECNRLAEKEWDEE